MKIVHFAFAGLVLALGAWCAARWFAPHSQIVEVVQDEKVILRIDLSQERAPRTLTVRSAGGGHNTLQIEHGAIRVVSADCPGGDCVRMGVLRSASAPLVCLPHRLVVRFAQGSGGALDGVSQ